MLTHKSIDSLATASFEKSDNTTLKRNVIDFLRNSRKDFQVVNVVVKMTGHEFISKGAYDYGTREFFIEMNSGSSYVYDDVPVSVWQEFARRARAGVDAGKYYNEIKTEYGPGQKVSSQDISDAAKSVANKRTQNDRVGLKEMRTTMLEAAKLEISSAPYVFVAGLSVSGTGVFALAAYESTPDLKTLIGAMQADFADTIDTSCSDLCRLRFVTLDPDLIIKGEVSPATLSERTVPAGDLIRCGVEALDNLLEKNPTG